MSIFEIQGAGHTSPLLGTVATATGIVTAVESNGFYFQDPVGDDNLATSDALFVFTGSAPGVSLGDELEVTGTVSEFFPGGEDTRNLSTTQISGNPTVTVLSSGNPLPEAVVIGAGGRPVPTENIDDDAFASFDPTTDGIDFFESLEGMYVRLDNAVAIAPTNRFGEIFAVADGGTGATGLSQRGTLNISPDDFNPERIQIDEDSDLLPGFDFPEVAVGDQLSPVVGVISYDFGNFQIQPTDAFGVITPSQIAAETSSLAADPSRLTVASYNVLNLDPVVENIANVAGQEARNVDDDAGNGRFVAIATQIVNNLSAPDIIGLQEVQDNDGGEVTTVAAADVTLQTLIDAIAAAGGPTYAFIDTPGIVPAFVQGDEVISPVGGQPGGNIRTAFLYNPDRVTLVEGSVQTLTDPADQAVNPDNPFFDSRIPLSASFQFQGETVTVVNSHFSSKGGSAPILGVEQPFEALQEDPTVNGSLDERQAQAEAVKAFVDDILVADPTANVIALGDLNEFEFISPVEDILGSSLTNLVDTLPENERYSFIFQGNSQQLDHILVSESLVEDAQIDIVHTNVEFAETETRASDHEPVLASLAFDGATDDNVLTKIGGFTSELGAEIVAHDPDRQRLYVVSGGAELQVLDISDPTQLVPLSTLDIAAQQGSPVDGANSVAISNGLMAIAFAADPATDPGFVALIDLAAFEADPNAPNALKFATVGALPDMVTFTPDGSTVLVANEGEPGETVDPEGSISLIDVSGGIANFTQADVRTADFTAFNGQEEALRAAGVRIFPDVPVAQDVEPEFITVSPDGGTAYVALQEANSVAVVDIATATVSDILPLGAKDFSLDGNQLDASDEDGGINIQNWPVFGLPMPDSIASYEVGGVTYFVTANEGDDRGEDVRIADITLDPTAFPDAANLQLPENLGRLNVSSIDGDTDGDGDYDQLFSYGARSFSIYDELGNLVFDSGDQIATLTAAQTPELFNADDGDPAEFDSRSDNKGAEPEGLTLGEVNGRTYAFVGLERAGGGVLVYDITNPVAPEFLEYMRTDEDVSPEGLTFISAANSPNGENLLVVANEVSSTVAVFAFNPDGAAPGDSLFTFAQYQDALGSFFGINLPEPTSVVGGVAIADFFDETVYLGANADVAAAVAAGVFTSGFEHFVNFGATEGRDPSLLFDNQFYLSGNADVAAAVAAGAFSSGLEHFLLFGAAEGRDPSAVFDQSDYLAANADVAAAVAAGAFTSGFEHYVEFGAAEGRDPNLLLFNEAFYVSNNADVAAAVQAGAFADGYDHFLQFGATEGRAPSGFYSEGTYLALNPDVAGAVAAGQLPSGFAHFVTSGRPEGREAV